MGMKLGARIRIRGYLRLRLLGGSQGFTIAETIIVLGVTGALFVAIAATLSGRQNAAEFTHAIQSIQSELQQTINQVPAGAFTDHALSCTNGGGAPLFTIGGSQGTNDACVYLGKVVQFYVAGSGGASPEKYQTYTIAGLRQAQAGPSSPFQPAVPTVVGVRGNYTSYSDARILQYGLRTAWVRSDNNLTCQAQSCSIGAVAFLMEPGNASSSVSGYSSGAQQVDLIPLNTSALNQSVAQMVADIQNSQIGLGGLRDPDLTTSAPVNPANGVQICFASGGTNQSGLITIGSSGRQLLVILDIKNGQSC